MMIFKIGSFDEYATLLTGFGGCGIILVEAPEGVGAPSGGRGALDRLV